MAGGAGQTAGVRRGQLDSLARRLLLLVTQVSGPLVQPPLSTQLLPSANMN